MTVSPTAVPIFSIPFANLCFTIFFISRNNREKHSVLLETRQKNLNASENFLLYLTDNSNKLGNYFKLTFTTESKNNSMCANAAFSTPLQLNIISCFFAHIVFIAALYLIKKMRKR